MPTLNDILTTCQEYYIRTRANSSRTTWSSHVRVLSARWPGAKARDLSKNEITAYGAEILKAGKSANTFNHRLAFLRCAYRLAIDAGQLEHDPTVGVRCLRARNMIHRDLTLHEEADLRLRIPQARAWSIVRFAILTGLRRAEQFRLKVRDINFGKSGMHVLGSKGTRVRWIPLAPEALSIAQAWAKIGLVPVVTANPMLCNLWPGVNQLPVEKLLQASQPGNPYLFLPEETGDRLLLGRQFTVQQFTPAVKESGIPATRWTDLRHAFASRIVQQPEATLYHAQQLLGHTDPKMTMRYAHLQDQHLRRFTDGLR